MQATLPPKIAELLDLMQWVQERNERYALLAEWAERFREVPPEVATRPFPEENRVPYCESQAYIWVKENPDHTFTFFFAVDNPQGLSAKAMAAILAEGCSGVPAWQVANLPDDLAQRLFGRELSMGRDMGLSAMVATVKAAARRHVQACPVCRAKGG